MGLKKLKYKKIPGGACPQTSLEVRNLSVFILDFKKYHKFSEFPCFQMLS